MSAQVIKEAMEKVEAFMQTQTGPEPDSRATAVMEAGLKCRVESASGKFIYTDMPDSVGGTATANSPGWLMRAAVASCDACLLTMRAARTGVVLDSVKVSVDGWSDGRGMFLDQGISPGSTELRVLFEVESASASRAQIQALVNWVIEHSPVGTDMSQAVKVAYELKTGH